MSLPLFAENLAYVAAVTEALNALPETKDFYIHVELRTEGDHVKVGAWSDEIANDAWYFEATEERKS